MNAKDRLHLEMLYTAAKVKAMDASEKGNSSLDTWYSGVAEGIHKVVVSLGWKFKQEPIRDGGCGYRYELIRREMGKCEDCKIL